MKRIDLRLALYYRKKAKRRLQACRYIRAEKEKGERESTRKYIKLQDDHLTILRRNKELMLDSIQYLKDIEELKQEIYLLKRMK